MMSNPTKKEFFAAMAQAAGQAVPGLGVYNSSTSNPTRGHTMSKKRRVRHEWMTEDQAIGAIRVAASRMRRCVNGGIVTAFEHSTSWGEPKAEFWEDRISLLFKTVEPDQMDEPFARSNENLQEAFRQGEEISNFQDALNILGGHMLPAKDTP